MSAFCVVRAINRRSDSATSEARNVSLGGSILQQRARALLLTVADNLAAVAERLDELPNPSGGRQDILLNLLRPVREQDAEQLEGEEAEVKVRGGQEGEESVEWSRRREERVRVAESRVVADRLHAPT